MADVGTAVEICDPEQADNMKLNLVWQLRPRDIGGATEDINPALQSSPSVLETSKLIFAQALSNADDDLVPGVRTGQVEGSKETGCHHRFVSLCDPKGQD